MSRSFDNPCSAYVTDEHGQRWYCEQGPEGHVGTCHGSKSRMAYLAERKAIKDARRATKGVATLVLVVLALASCSGYDDERGRGDAPVGQTDDQPAEIINFPDLFNNIAIKCDHHGHRVYVTTSGVPLVIADPSCPGDGGS